MGKWSVVGWPVGRWSVDLIKSRKNMFGVVISMCPLVEVYYVTLILIFSISTTDNKEETNLRKQSLLAIPKDI